MATDSTLIPIEVNGISKTFTRGQGAESVEALRDVDVIVRQNSFVTVLGPSGCGKTTLLRIINGILKPDSGVIRIYGNPPKPGPLMGFVFQSFRLMEWRTVSENIGLPLEIQGVPREERLERVHDYIERVELGGFNNSFPSELSGGMKQRVALARALVTEPKILLMDEPFASLDAQTRELMQIELLRLWQRIQGEVMFVTHSVDEAITLSDKIVVLSGRPGQVVEILEVGLPRPRWEYDLRSTPEYAELRRYLWTRIKEMVTQ